MSKQTPLLVYLRVIESGRQWIVAQEKVIIAKVEKVNMEL
jgi:hypothetical protein